MDRTKTHIACKLLLLVAVFAPTSICYKTFQALVPNGDAVPNPCKPDNGLWPGLGHKNSLGGGDRNPFGLDFGSAEFMWSPDLCGKDSDNDTRTNGEELGDPNCVWSKGQLPEITTGITHPGICEPVDSEICKKQNPILECGVKDPLESCAALDNSGIQTMEIRFTESRVPNTETNYYCQTFDLPTEEDFHIVAHEAIIDNAEVLHHMILYGCETLDKKQYPIPAKCGMAVEFSVECNTIIGVWSVGISGVCYGDKVGFRMGKTGFQRVKLEVHWNNPELRSDYKDASGLKLYYQRATPSVHDLSTIMLGQLNLEIPPGKSAYEQVGICSGACTNKLLKEPIYVTAVFNHMHNLGSSMSVEVFRDGKLYKTLSHDEAYDYNHPIIHNHRPPVQLLPGDQIKTTCVYNTMNSDHYTYYGESTQDEMCFAFVSMYPPTALIKVPVSCISEGPMDECAVYFGQPIGDCTNWNTFLSETLPESIKMYTALKKNCSLDGFCRPECRKISAQTKRHPCLQGEAGKFMMSVLQKTSRGIEFLGRLFSCPDTDGGSSGPVDCGKYCTTDMCPGTGWTRNTGDQRSASVLVALLSTTMAVIFVTL